MRFIEFEAEGQRNGTWIGKFGKGKNRQATEINIIAPTNGYSFRKQR